LCFAATAFNATILIPRQIRIEHLGAIYRVFSRGDRREAIFLDDGIVMFLRTRLQEDKVTHEE